MGMINEDELEQLCQDWSRDQGYDFAYGPDIAPDGDAPWRSDYRQDILQGCLLTAQQTINSTIPVGKLEEVATTS